MEFKNLQTKSIENFPLKWRWTDPKYNVLSKEELFLILPLNSESAKIVGDISASFESNDDSFSPSEKKFENIESIECRNSEGIVEWLGNRMYGDKIIVSWSPTMAVITSSKLFIKYWDDFCYPSSDDVSIWPESKEWVIHYMHEEMFWYGKAK